MLSSNEWVGQIHEDIENEAVEKGRNKKEKM